MGESVQGNPSDTISSTHLITVFLNVTMGIFKSCWYFCLYINDNFTIENILNGNHILLRSLWCQFLSTRCQSKFSALFYTSVPISVKMSFVKEIKCKNVYFFQICFAKNQQGWLTKSPLQLKPNCISKTGRYTLLITQEPTSQTRQSHFYFVKSPKKHIYN